MLSPRLQSKGVEGAPENTCPGRDDLRVEAMGVTIADLWEERPAGRGPFPCHAGICRTAVIDPASPLAHVGPGHQQYAAVPGATGGERDHTELAIVEMRPVAGLGQMTA